MVILDNLLAKRNRKFERKKIKEKDRIKIENSIVLTKEQKKQIDEFYKKNYGKKIPYYWHKEYYAISGKFDYRFFPELLFIPDFERIMNNPKYYDCLQDKNITNLFADKVNIKNPKCYLRNVNGLLLDEDYKDTTIENVYHNIKGLDKVFIKPTIESGSGKDCEIIFTNELTIDSFKSILNKFKKDYIIQDVVVNSNSIKKLNPTSLNTFRIITYILDGKVYAMPAVLRIGRNGKYLDNAHQGGIFIGVTRDGVLLDTATSEFNDKYKAHPDTNVIFKDYKIDNFNEIIEAAINLQKLIPHVGCINWDLTLDQNEDVVLIEGNMRYGGIWIVQMAHGISAFEDNTARVLQLIKANKRLY